MLLDEMLLDEMLLDEMLLDETLLSQSNNHMKSIHGIDTDLERQTPQTPTAPTPTFQEASNPGIFTNDVMVPLLRAIKGNSQK